MQQSLTDRASIEQRRKLHPPYSTIPFTVHLEWHLIRNVGTSLLASTVFILPKGVWSGATLLSCLVIPLWTVGPLYIFASWQTSMPFRPEHISCVYFYRAMLCSICTSNLVYKLTITSTAVPLSTVRRILWYDTIRYDTIWYDTIEESLTWAEKPVDIASIIYCTEPKNEKKLWNRTIKQTRTHQAMR